MMVIIFLILIFVDEYHSRMCSAHAFCQVTCRCIALSDGKNKQKIQYDQEKQQEVLGIFSWSFLKDEIRNIQTLPQVRFSSVSKPFQVRSSSNRKNGVTTEAERRHNGGMSLRQLIIEK